MKYDARLGFAKIFPQIRSVEQEAELDKETYNIIVVPLKKVTIH